MTSPTPSPSNQLYRQPNRRTFLADCGMGFTGLALNAMLAQEGLAATNTKSGAKPKSAHAPPDGRPHFAPKAKSVIWLFMMGGVSHMESFDPKPMLNKYAGMSFDDSPFRDAVLNSPFYRKNVRDFAGGPRKLMGTLYPLQVGYKKHGQSGIEISDWWPHLAKRIDDLAIVRSIWTTDNDHAAQLQFHTGRHIFDGLYPALGSWVHYGLGSLNENLPQYIAIGPPPGDCCGGVGAHGAAYLGPEHAGVKLRIDPNNPLSFGTPGKEVRHEERRQQLEYLRELNSLAGAEYPHDPIMRARIKSYELAYRMQSAIPEAMGFSAETPATRDMYGLEDATTKTFGEQCLAARRLVERGVRFVQLYHGGGGGGSWDAHSKLKSNHGRMTKAVDQPIAALLEDLKQRGMLDETLVVWASEFGRTPGAERSDGRDHHPYGFSVWMAGGGIKGGVVHGATDEVGFHAVEHRHYVTDIHATILHQLGLDPRRLEVAGQKRLDVDFGAPIKEIIA